MKKRKLPKQRGPERKERQRNREAENGEGERDREIKNCSLQSESEKVSQEGR